MTGILALTALLVAAAAGDWPQWRGPSRNGITGSVTTEWPKALRKAWSVEVGEGHAAPLIALDRVYVHARVGEDEVLSALDRATGRVLWSQRRPTPYTLNSAAAGHGKGPKSTPLFHGGRIFTFGIDGMLAAYDAATGAPAWQRGLGAPTFGTAQSPLGEGDLVIVHGAGGTSALVAVDAATGRPRWSWSGDGPGYASPVAATLAGVRQVVALSASRVVGLAMADGRLLWSQPFTTDYEQNAVTPVIDGDRVIVSGLDRGLIAWTIEPAAPAQRAVPAFDVASPSFYMSSPVLHRGRLFGLSHRQKGQVVAVDASTGTLLWSGPGRQGDNASLVMAGDDLLVLSTEGELTVSRPGAGAAPVVGRYSVADSSTWAHMAVAPGTVLVKDARHLTSWRTR